MKNTDLSKIVVCPEALGFYGSETSEEKIVLKVIGTIHAPNNQLNHGKVIAQSDLGSLVDLNIASSEVKEGDEIKFNADGSFHSINEAKNS